MMVVIMDMVMSMSFVIKREVDRRDVTTDRQSLKGSKCTFILTSEGVSRLEHRLPEPHLGPLTKEPSLDGILSGNIVLGL